MSAVPVNGVDDASLLRFLYRAPIALVQSAPDGEIVMLTPVAAQLLMPLAPAGRLTNLFDTLALVAPQLRSLVVQQGNATGTVCENLTIPVHGGPQPRLLALSMMQTEPGRLITWLNDVTDALGQAERARLAAGHQLAELSASLQQALSVMQVAVMREELASGRVTLNDRLQAWLGLADTGLGWTVDALLASVHPADRVLFLGDRRLAQQGHPAAFRPYRLRRQDGRWRWIAGQHVIERDPQGQALRLTSFGIDVTEQRAAEAERLALADQLQLATQAAGMGIFELGTPDGQLRWDAQTRRLHGWPDDDTLTAHQMLGASLAEPAHADFTAWMRQLVAGQDSGTFEYPVCGPDGQVRWLGCRGQRRLDETGECLSVNGVVWDITDARQHQALLEARRVADQANAAKSAFLSRISHEFHTPLNAILGFARVLRSSGDTPPTERQQRQLGHIVNAGEHLLALVDELMDISRMANGSHAPARLPSAEQAPPRAPLATPADRVTMAPDPLPQGRVLCVEGNPASQALVRHVLALRPGVQLTVCGDGASALAAVQAQPPDLLLLDMSLPDTQGLALWRTLRRRQPPWPAMHCVVTSALVTPADRSAALAEGVQHYLNKPIDPAELLRTVDALLAGQRSGGAA